MKLPNPDKAVVDMRKLRDYCLNPQSPKGRDKARVFASVLGLNQNDADTLKEVLLRAAAAEDCTPGEQDEYGRRFTIRFEMRTSRGIGWIQSGWFVRHDEDFARLTTCFVIRRR
ncbi:MAG: DUF6883 domain-containing protein [Candidatus Hydrogenedentales bacterium]|jgi:hypothetical protein